MRTRFSIIVLAVACLVVAVFLPSVLHDFFLIDDTKLLLNNATAHGLTWLHLWQAFTTYDPELYIPLTLLSFQLEWSLVGANPAVYHGTNIVLHTGSTVLVLLWVRRLSNSVLVAVVCGVLYGLHPIQAEAVLWISGRKDVLAGLFCHASILTYLVHKEQRNRTWLYVSLVCFACSLLSKVSAVMLPVGLVLIDYYQTGPTGMRMLRDKTVYFALAALFLLIGFVGKIGVFSVYSVGLLATGLLATLSVWQYLWLFIHPVSLAKIYPYTGEVSSVNPLMLGSAALLLLMLLLVLSTKWRARSIFFGALFFLFMLLPALGSQQRLLWDGWVLAVDRFVYIASVGVFFMAGAAVRELHQRYPRYRVLTLSGCTVLLMAYASITVVRVYLWRSPVFVIHETLVKYPSAYVGDRILARYYSDQGDYRRATLLLEMLIDRVPKDDASRAYLAALYQAQGQPAKALDQLSQVSDSNTALKFQLMRVDAAINNQDYTTASNILTDLATHKRHYPQWYWLMAELQYAKGDLDSAEIYLREGIEAHPLDTAGKAALTRLLKQTP